MKKAAQYSDKFGMIVEAGKEPEARVTPGVAMEAAKPKVEKKTAAKPKVEKKTEKAEESSDKE